MKKTFARLATSAISIQNIKNEPEFKWRRNVAADPEEVPDEMRAIRGDNSFEARDSDGDISTVVVDYTIKMGNARERIEAENEKVEKYERAKTWAANPFIFIPAVMSTRGTMQRQCEGLFKYVASRYLIGVQGSYSTTGVNAILGNMQARVLKLEFSMFLLTRGIEGSEGRDPAFAFSDSIPQTPSAIIQTAGRVSEQKSKAKAEREIKAEIESLKMKDDLVEEAEADDEAAMEVEEIDAETDE